MTKPTDQATVPKPVGDSHFSMERGSYDDTVMEKIRNRKLNLSAVKVYMYLSRNRDIDTGILHGSPVKSIAEYWGISIRSVRYAIQDLIDAELYVPPNRIGVDKIEGTLLPKRKKDVPN